MILEAQLENKLIEQLSSLSSLSSGVQFIGSRQIGIADDGGIIDKDDVDTIVAIHTGYRSHDAFSLSPISVTVGLNITTRQEKDVTGTRHEEIVETISNQLSYWHFYSDQFTSTFQLPNMFCGELRSSGGSGRKYDDKNEAWIDTLTFTIRGSEIFPQVSTPTFSPTSQSFSNPISVSIACDTVGAEIRYTLDGTAPTQDSPLYSSPIQISTTTTINAKGYKAPFDPSQIKSETYTYVLPPPVWGQGKYSVETYGTTDYSTSHDYYYYSNPRGTLQCVVEQSKITLYRESSTSTYNYVSTNFNWQLRGQRVDFVESHSGQRIELLVSWTE